MKAFTLTECRVALYTRSLNLEPDIGRVMQEDSCADFVTQHGGSITQRFADLKVSCEYPHAFPGLTALEQACIAGQVDYIVVYSSDRIMRHRAQWDYLNTICASGAEILSVRENLALCPLVQAGLLSRLRDSWHGAQPFQLRRY
ncbi:MAG TPA: recombinase family protein [Anaerolineaceae bacterium]|nr:recombinase family protein [Anaerolineaceae bacterium]